MFTAMIGLFLSLSPPTELCERLLTEAFPDNDIEDYRITSCTHEGVIAKSDGVTFEVLSSGTILEQISDGRFILLAD